MFRRLYQKRPTLVILGGLALLTSPCWGGVGFLFGYVTYIKQFVWTAEDRAHKGEGHPSDARKWRTLLEPIPDLDACERGHPELTSSPSFVKIRFPNGEWVFGVASDSHAWFDNRGGTVVLKDSRGLIRVFFGHVCGAGSPMYSYSGQAKSLDEFYTTLTMNGSFTEQFLPP
jgi:hypothetical protein